MNRLVQQAHSSAPDIQDSPMSMPRRIVAMILVIAAILLWLSLDVLTEANHLADRDASQRTSSGAIVIHRQEVRAVTAKQADLHEHEDPVFAHLREHWRVPAALAQEILVATKKAENRYEISADLVLAIMATESSFRHAGNPNGGNNPLRPYGLMQVDGRWHPEKFPGGKPRLTQPKENILIGAHVLREYLDREDGNVERALQRYNGALHDPDQKYAAKVLRYRAQFESLMSVDCQTRVQYTSSDNGAGLQCNS